MTSFVDRVRRSARKHESRVVLALDSSEPYGRRLAHAEAVLEATKKRIAAVKINHHLLLPFGLEGVKGLASVCKDEGLPLIADLKLNDIESTNLNAVDSLLSYGFDAVIANPFVGKQGALGRVMERVHEHEGGVLLLVYMSHAGADEGYGLRLEGGEPLYRVFATRAKEWGADGVVVSANSKDKISETRDIVGKECLIFSPGIGAQGGEPAGSSGADFLIVGRAISEASDPAEAARELNSTL